ncbi:N-6 DNA methylase [Ruegeria arenilitoris]|uniref:N-6 DNA methylase n=1 Tax=Ruegeria arenilitoris TaxID=1173585 RepID=UPI00147D01FD|nr:N-6 DNA methylase [Ruegeria arenilitoris]
MIPAVTDFVRIINELDRSKHRDEIFRDFCELAYCALAKRACPDEDQRDALEVQYMEVVGRYRNKDDIRRMPELLAIMAGTIGNGGCDFLGLVAGELGVLDAKLGQFFTPYEVSRMMAEMTLTDAKATIEAEGFITIDEPAAGAGGMLLAVADTIEGMGFELETSVWFRATELSRATYHMAYLQLTARGLAGQVIHGNSISLETFTGAYTAAAPVFVGANGDPFAKQKAEREAQARAEAEKAAQDEAERKERVKALGDGPAIQGDQLSLF